MRIRDKVATGLMVAPGQDIEVIETGLAYFDVKIQPTDDNMLIIEGSNRSTCIGASTAVYILAQIGGQS